MASIIPSRLPDQDDSLLGVLNVAMRKFGEATQNMLPVRVQAHDRTKNRLTVEHLIQQVTTLGTNVPRGTLSSVPALVLGDSNFFINYEIPIGSLGWIKATDRDISLFLQFYNSQPPNDDRIHDFSSSVFIPDKMTGYTIAAEDENAMVIQNSDGSTKISISASQITVKRGINTLIILEEENLRIVQGSSNIIINDQQMQFTSNDVLALTLTSQNATFGVPIIDSNGIDINDHTHTQAQDSGGNTEQDTGVPQ